MLRVLANTTLLLLAVVACIKLDVTCVAAEATVPSGSVLWLDATDIDGDGQIDGSSNPNTTVKRWADKSGHANHIVQQDSSRQPSIIPDALQNQPTVRFDGNDLLTLEKFAGLSIRDQPLHILMVMRSQEAESPKLSRLIEWQPEGGDLTKPATVKQQGLWLGRREDGHMRIGTHYGDEGPALTTAWDGKPHLVEVVYTGAQAWVHYLNGARNGGGLLGDRDFRGFTKDLRFAVGQHYGSTAAETYFRGDIAEILVFDRVLSHDEQNRIKEYLGSKWALKLSIQEQPLFEHDVVPILAEYCFECHGEDSQEAGVDLRTVTAMLQGGERGPVISRGRPEFSDLLDLIEAGKMPPEGMERPDAKQLAILRRWIEAGAPAEEVVETASAADLISAADRNFWAFQPLQQNEVPHVSEINRVHTAVDSFVLSKIEENSLTLNEEASRETLAVRAHFDLLGLPPSPEELAEFLNDNDVSAYERLIDRLFASKHFGERWGRSWLDWAGYVDVYGRDNDFSIIKPLEGRWRYRDYVVRAFNEDKPFDQFLLEQMAGDELVDWRAAESLTPDMLELLTATGFLLCADDDTDADELNTPDIRHYVLQQTGEVVANNLFALTVHCAKCHNHKYEAISQLDYYQWLANFAPVFNPQRWVTSVEHSMPMVTKREQQAIERRNQEIEAEAQRLDEQRDALRAKYHTDLYEKKLKVVPESQREALTVALDLKQRERTQSQQQLVDTYEKQVDVSSVEIAAVMSPEDLATIAGIARKIKAVESQKQSYDILQAAVEQSPPSSTRLLRRGEVTKPGVEVEPAMFAILHDRTSRINSFKLPPGSSGRRLAIARQITNANTIAGALVARVFVNRIWQELFGIGIVETSDNFGVSGARPTHPELLDWLAAEFIRSGWRVKPLIKLMMMSSTYQQASVRSDSVRTEKDDPANRLLWKAKLRRLPAEYVRDRVLATSGKLDRTIGGQPVPLLAQPDGKMAIDTENLPTATSHLRRSMYILNRRNYHLSMLTTFDQPFLTSNCTCRKPSAVVTQSLTMLNDQFIVEQSQEFAKRVIQETQDEHPESWITQMYQLALCRSPTTEEQHLCMGLWQRQKQRFIEEDASDKQASQRALAELCHMLLNTNEFLYVQ